MCQGGLETTLKGVVFSELHSLSIEPALAWDNLSKANFSDIQDTQQQLLGGALLIVNQLLEIICFGPQSAETPQQQQAQGVN